VPDVPLGSHTASLGLVFDDKNSFPEKYKGGLLLDSMVPGTVLNW